jgi:hypothetical protein
LETFYAKSGKLARFFSSNAAFAKDALYKFSKEKEKEKGVFVILTSWIG